ncbi:MAG: alpha/beta hydrolase [Phycisphaerales bacterium]|nr:alpha/beta hydrolase [Phycisphaerales bacterium]
MSPLTFRGILAVGIRLLIASTVAVVLGCAKHRMLMPAPALYSSTSADLSQATLECRRGPTTEVLYATDRQYQPDRGSDPYPPERERFLRLGVAEVAIGPIPPEQATWDTIASQSGSTKRDLPIALSLASVDDFGPLAESTVPFDPVHFDPDVAEAGRRFAELVNRRLGEATHKDIVVYVAPFKVAFDEAVLAAAEFHHFLGRDGVFIAYSWPSKEGNLSYFNAAENAYRTRRCLRVFLEYLFANTAAERVHLLTYSAGARVLSGALHQLALVSRHLEPAQVAEQIRLGNVIFSSPDMDAGAFLEHAIEEVGRIPGTVTIYTSKKDGALKLSRVLYGNGRLGTLDTEDFLPQGIEFLSETNQFTFVSVMAAKGATSGNGHGYFRLSPWVSTDILLMLGRNLPPAERGLFRSPGDPIWRFPEDYEDRIQAIGASWGRSGDVPANPPGS